MRVCKTWIAAFVLTVPLAGLGQAPNAGGQQDLVQALLARVERLERRVAELEGRPESAPPAPAARTVPAMIPAEGAQMGAAGEATATSPSLRLAGFSDFNFSATDQRGTLSQFAEGQLILHLSSSLSSKVHFFGELSASARRDAGTGDPSAPGFNFEVERGIVRFDQNDYFKVSFGRYHTPINWWNTSFHHGQWLQTSVSRPEMTRFGGSFIPVHFVGGLVEGALPSGGLNLNYAAGLGNGRGSVISRGGDAGDSNNHRAWLVHLFAKPDRFYGLQVGGALYRDRIALGGRQFGEWITSGHIAWQRENPELIAEFANVRHLEEGGATAFNSQAYYVQAAYRLPGAGRLWKPYYRFEYTHVPRSDAIFQAVPNLAGSVVGVRYDISSFAAVKAEYRNQRRVPSQERVNGGFLQTSFTF